MNATFPPTMDALSAEYTTTPFAAVDARGIRYYASEDRMRTDLRNAGARLVVVNRLTGEWSDA